MSAKRLADGTFPKGVSGNPKGRPIGSKNKVNVLKVLQEETFREANATKIAQVLNDVVRQALDGAQWAQKIIWEASISKANISEEKATADNAPQITIRHMEVKKEGDVIEPIGEPHE